MLVQPRSLPTPFLPEALRFSRPAAPSSTILHHTHMPPPSSSAALRLARPATPSGHHDDPRRAGRAAARHPLPPPPPLRWRRPGGGGPGLIGVWQSHLGAILEGWLNDAGLNALSLPVCPR